MVLSESLVVSLAGLLGSDRVAPIEFAPNEFMVSLGD
jgi:hypothetical protein